MPKWWSGGFIHLSMIILTWNIRGLGREEKRRAVKNLVQCHKPYMVFIQETKLNYFDSRIVKALGGSILSKGIGVEAVGSAGGLITLWDEEFFEVTDCISNESCIIISVVLTKLGKEVIFCNVYAASQESSRVEL
jgi:exonuclease III